MRDIDTLTTREMDQEEWDEMRRRWIAEYSVDIVRECGVPEEDSQSIAECRWEDYCGQEGWTMRDERIHMKREGVSSYSS